MKITITAGHGGGKPGNTWGGHTEANLMTQLRFLVAMKLRELGHEVTEDGARDENWELAEAQKLIAGADLAIELHTNASANRNAEGVEVVAPPSRSALAQRLAHAIGGVLRIPPRRVAGWFPLDQFKRELGYTPGFVGRGGLIVEVFFQSNPKELAAYLERTWLVASAIARAVDDSLQPQQKATS